MSDPIRMPASYDAWATAGPPEHVMVCPKCGTDAEQMEELEVRGLDGYGLLKYPLYVTEFDPTGVAAFPRKRVTGINPAREQAYFVTISKCDCGLILSDDALVTAEEFGDHRDPEG